MTEPSMGNSAVPMHATAWQSNRGFVRTDLPVDILSAASNSAQTSVIVVDAATTATTDCDGELASLIATVERNELILARSFADGEITANARLHRDRCLRQDRNGALNTATLASRPAAS